MSLLFNLFLLTGLFSLDGQPIANKRIVVSYHEINKGEVDSVIYTNDKGIFELALDTSKVDSIVKIYALFPDPYIGVAYKKVNIKSENIF